MEAAGAREAPAVIDPDVVAGGENSVFPIDFEFKDIHLSVKLSRPRPWKSSPGKREILKCVSGFVKSGESLAILGPSGSGKTTLLDVLADRRKKSAFKGERLMNGDPNISSYRYLTAYVPQSEAMFPRLTVEESLLYSARLRLPSSLPDAEKKAVVDRVIDLLGLQSCRRGMVGGRGSVRGVSGGERRRTSVGMELVTSPSLLFLDEPTSGLDSASALAVAHIVRALASKGRTIVLTIHQPSAVWIRAILSCFTNVLFLSEGQVMYYGPPNKLTNFMERIGRPLPEGANPADYMLELISDPNKDTAAIAETAAQFAPARDVEAPMHEPISSASRNEYKKSRPGFLKQSAILVCFSFMMSALCLSVQKTYRNFLISIRSPEIFLGRVLLLAMNALLLSSVFWRRGEDNTIDAANEILGFIIFSVAMSMFTSFQALPIFLDEKDIYRRERGSGYYRLSAYTIALLLVQLPLLALLAFLYTGISYYLVGLAPGADNFFFFVFLMFSTLFAAQSFVLFLSAAVPNAGAGQGIGAATFSYFFLFAGFFIAAREIPSYWIWVYWISLFRYPLQAGAQNQFLDPSVGPFNVCANTPSSGNNNDPACLLQGKAMLDYLGIDSGINKWVLLVILCGFAVLYRLLFFLILVFFITSKRR